MSIERYPPGDVTDRRIDDVSELIAYTAKINQHIAENPRPVSDALRVQLDGSLQSLGYRASLVLGNIAIVRQRIAEADEKLNHYLKDRPPMNRYQEEILRARFRFNEFPGKPHIVTDLDGTYTYEIPGEKPHYYDTHIPGTPHSKPILNRLGHKAFAEAYLSGWYIGHTEYPEVMRSAGRLVKIRDGASDFFDAIEAAEWSRSMLSTAFRPFVEGVLDQYAQSRSFFGSKLRVVETYDVSAVDKAANITEIAGNHPDNPIFYLGDGGSDTELPDDPYSPIVATAALYDGKYEAKLVGTDTPHLKYKDLSDVARIVRDIEQVKE